MEETPAARPASSLVRRAGLGLGPLLFAAVLAAGPPPGLSTTGLRVLAVTLWTAVWWMTEALPVNATALLPVVLLPLLGVMSSAAVAKAGMDHPVQLFLGGLLLAAAIERWGLPRRIALRTLAAFGTSPRRLVFGVMATVAFLSMWITNTAAAVMVLPILMALIRQAEAGLGRGRDAARFAAALLLGTALAANIGGMGTPIGTVPNALLVKKAGTITFLGWMKLGVPVVLTLLPIAWLLLVAVTTRLPRSLPFGDREGLRRELRALGPMTVPERRVALLFLAAVLLWLGRQDLEIAEGVHLPGWSSVLEGAGVLPAGASEGLSDATVALAVAILLFVVPARSGGPRLLDWETAAKIPWGVLLLLGGGFVLAAGFELEGEGGSSLGAWLGDHLGGLAGLPLWAQVLGVTLLVSGLTEVASNSATCALMLPLIYAFASGTGAPALPLGYAAALGASCSFMMPVATPPNALVFGTGLIPMGVMIRNGLLLNVAAALVIAFWIRLLA